MFNPFLVLEIHHYLGIIALIVLLVAFHKRAVIKERWIAFRETQLNYLPLHSDDLGSSSSSWLNDIGQGLSSKTFNLFSDNLFKNDQRKGLDENAKNEVLKIMNEQNLSFDEARLLYLKNKMGDNNIGEDGIPRDPKFVRFL